MARANGRVPWPRGGDGAAGFGAWCAELERPLYSYLLRMTGSPEDAEDVAQDAFLRVFRVWRSGRLRRDESEARSLVFKTAHNLAVDLLRKRNRPQPDPPEPAAAASAMDGEATRIAIAQALAQLPADQRGALLLREYGGLSYAEIAKAMDATLDAVKVRIHRARRRLAELLDREGRYIAPPQETSKS